MDVFRQEFCKIYGMTLEPLLNIYLQAGLSALKTPYPYYLLVAYACWMIHIHCSLMNRHVEIKETPLNLAGQLSEKSGVLLKF